MQCLNGRYWMAAATAAWIAFTVMRAGAAEPPTPLRMPAVPLVVVDPYFSTWSFADRLTDDWTKHWTGANHAMAGLIRIDGQTYRFMGRPRPEVPAMQQVDLRVDPTQTVYRFEEAGIRLTLTFLTPALPEDIEALALPITYVTFGLEAIDGKEHEAALYFDISAEWVVNTVDQPVVWQRQTIDGDKPLTAMRLGTAEQPILAKAGDNLRIDWGYLYAATQADAPGLASVLASADEAREAFSTSGAVPEKDDLENMPRAASDDWPSAALVWRFDSLGAERQSRRLILAYDDIYGIEYFGEKLPSYWRRDGKTIESLLSEADRRFDELAQRCRAFDQTVWEETRRAGGEKYARLCVAAFRQCLGAHKLVADRDGTPLYFSKECFSNGCIATVDVTYPTGPFFVHYNTTLLKGQLRPIFRFARSEAWQFPFAPHDVGTYPKANGQVYGGNRLEGQMPVEESGNILILTAALCLKENDAAFARENWDLLTRWAEYLRDNGLDPANQLCTADMFGHLPHNADLSVKAIIGLGGYARLCEMLGEEEQAKQYRQIAQQYADRWMEMAVDDRGYSRLAFDQPGTWGMKHNLVWDRVLGLNLFPKNLGDAETSLYLAKQNPFGLPCDNRTPTSLLDWAVWCASLARNQDDFEQLIAPLYRYADETPSRVPLSDWFFTTDGRQQGFQARSVVGGIFMRLLAPAEPDAEPVARLPDGRGSVLVPTAMEGSVEWRFTTDDPGEKFTDPVFDDSAWTTGRAGFGTTETPGAMINTKWETPSIWLRLRFDYDGKPFERAVLKIDYDENAEVWLNGRPIASLPGYTTQYMLYDVTQPVRENLKEGENLLAVRCRQTTGGQAIDVGLLLDATDPAEPLPPRLPPIEPLFDHPVRDTSICLGPDGMYYLTGTTANRATGGDDPNGWWYVNEGIRIWKSPDLKNWEPLGLVWDVERDGTWARRVDEQNGVRRRAVWAPEIAYIHGTFWLTYSMNYRGCGLLKSVSGKAEGPYRDVKTDGPLTDNIDASLFQDDDGQVYFVWQNGRIAKLNETMTGLVGEPWFLAPEGDKQVGFEGAFLTKVNGKYVLIAAEFNHRLGTATYDCMAAVGDRLDKPLSRRYLAIPHGGHNMLFQDKEGHWWATFFGSDALAPFRERPAILPVEFDADGRFHPVDVKP